MKKTIISIATLVTLAIPALAAADNPRSSMYRQSSYFTAFLGTSFASDADITVLDSTGTQVADDEVSFDPGINIGGTGGFDFGIVRIEGELSYKRNELDKIRDNSGANPGRLDGDIGALAFMFNTFIDLHNNSPITPYFGGGIGFAALHLSDTYVSNRTPSLYYLEDDTTVFAYQVGGGIDIALNRIISLDVGYRYFGTAEAEFEDNSAFETYETKFNSHNVAVGVKFKF